MKKTRSSEAECNWSTNESRLVKLRLQKFDDDWLGRWDSACFSFDGKEASFEDMDKLFNEKYSRTFEILSEVGSWNPCWGEPRFTHKVIKKYIRRIQADLKKSVSDGIPKDINDYFPKPVADFDLLKFEALYEGLLLHCIEGPMRAGEEAFRNAEIKWLEKATRTTTENVRASSAKVITNPKNDWNNRIGKESPGAEVEQLERPKQNQSSPQLQPVALINSNKEARRAAVDAYIEEVFSKTGKRIRRTDIWKRAGYKTRTEFERWERNDPKVNKTANERFTKILSEKPHLK